MNDISKKTLHSTHLCLIKGYTYDMTPVLKPLQSRKVKCTPTIPLMNGLFEI